LLIFDYATQYRNTHAKITDARDFALSDADYADFVKYLADKNYSYNSPTEKLLDQMKDEATKDKQFSEIQSEYNSLKTKLAATKRNDLQLNKDEIKQVLENEITSRYYFERGRYEVNFRFDTDISQAIKTMQDKAQLDSITKGVGQYKIIGKPVAAVIAAKKTDSDNDDDSDQ